MKTDAFFYQIHLRKEQHDEFTIQVKNNHESNLIAFIHQFHKDPMIKFQEPDLTVEAKFDPDDDYFKDSIDTEVFNPPSLEKFIELNAFQDKEIEI